MSSTRKEHNVDARAKGVASLFVACSSNPATIVKIPSAMRANGYSDTKTFDRALQMQVRSAAAPAALSAAAVMVRTRALVLIPPEDACRLTFPRRQGRCTDQATSAKLTARMSGRAKTPSAGQRSPLARATWDVAQDAVGQMTTLTMPTTGDIAANDCADFKATGPSPRRRIIRSACTMQWKP